MKKVYLVIIVGTIFIISGCIQQYEKPSANITQEETNNLTQMIAIQHQPFIDVFIGCKDIQNLTEKADCFFDTVEYICDTIPNKALELCKMENKTFAEELWGNQFCICAAVAAGKTNVSEAFKICNEVSPSSFLGLIPSSCYDLVANDLSKINPDKAVNFCNLVKIPTNYTCYENAASAVSEENPDKAIEICNIITPDMQICWCYRAVAYGIAKTDLEKALNLCNQADCISIKDYCYLDIVRYTLKKINPEKALELCNQIQTNYFKDECLRSLGK